LFEGAENASFSFPHLTNSPKTEHVPQLRHCPAVKNLIGFAISVLSRIAGETSLGCLHSQNDSSSLPAAIKAEIKDASEVLYPSQTLDMQQEASLHLYGC
jgi:hypothetical protein